MVDDLIRERQREREREGQNRVTLMSLVDRAHTCGDMSSMLTP